MEVDHESREVFVEEMRSMPEDAAGAAMQRGLAPSDESVASRLASPIVHTYLDTDKISFERYYARLAYIALAICPIIAILPPTGHHTSQVNLKKLYREQTESLVHCG